MHIVLGGGYMHVYVYTQGPARLVNIFQTLMKEKCEPLDPLKKWVS